MNSLYFLIAPLSTFNLLGLVAVLAVSISRHIRSKGASNDLPWALAAVGFIVGPRVIMVVALRFIALPFFLFIPVVILGFLLAYLLRTLAAGSVREPVQPIGRREPPRGAPIATPGYSPYGPPQPLSALPPSNPLFVQPAYPLASRSIDEMMLFVKHPRPEVRGF